MVPQRDEARVEARFGLLDIELILTQNRCTVCVEHTIGFEKSFWMHPMELLGDVGHVESFFDPFGDSVSASARKVPGMPQTYHRLKNHFGRT